MKTADFIAAVARFGWTLARTSKHALFTNSLFPASRPVTISLNVFRSKLDPEEVENVAKNMGLRWKDMDPEPRPRPNHPYFTEYQRLGLVQS